MACRSDDFAVVAVRLVAFTPNLADFKPSALLAAVLAGFAKRFDGDVQSIPLPQNAPPDIPRIQLSSSDGSRSFGASPSHITSAWNLKTDLSEPPAVGDVVADCREPLEHVVKDASIRVGRLGLVITRVRLVDNPAQEIIDRFCCDEVKIADSSDAPLRKSKSFELHNHKLYDSPAGQTINSWVRCRSGGFGEDKKPAVVVEQDINSLAEEMTQQRFGVAEIRDFFDMCLAEADTILRKYFPG